MIKRAWGVSLGLIVLWGGLVYFYLKACGPLWTRWYDNDYVHGYAVIPFALWLLWYRREWFPGFQRAKSALQTTSSCDLNFSDSATLRTAASFKTDSSEVEDSLKMLENARSMENDSVSHSKKKESRSSSWECFVQLLRQNALCQACALLFLGTVVQFAGQIVYYQVEVAAQVATRNALPTNEASPEPGKTPSESAESSQNNDQSDGKSRDTSATNSSEQEIHPPQQLQDELKFGVPGIATDFSRQQIVDCLKTPMGTHTFQLAFVRFHGDTICLIFGWFCFLVAAVRLASPAVVCWLDAIRPAAWGWFWGLAFLLLGGAIRIAGSFLSDPVLYPASLVPLLLGVVFLLGGTRLARWSAPSILFLGFMIPLPELLSIMFADKLQLIGTMTSVWLLQLFGIAADSSGNVITLPNGHLMGVIGACSGLKMLVLFFCICTAGMFIMRGDWLEKGIVLISAVPIAILSNVFRITITGFLYMYADSASAEKFFHDGAGMFMAPFAMLLLWGEIELMSILFVEPTLAETPESTETPKSEGLKKSAAERESVSDEVINRSSELADSEGDTHTLSTVDSSLKSISSDDQSVQEELNR